MKRIEKLGVFYLGREYDLQEKRASRSDIMYDARDLTSLDGVIDIVGNDNQMAAVRVSDMLTVTINGNGTVFYIGDPFVYSDISGSGTVQQIPDDASTPLAQLRSTESG